MQDVLPEGGVIRKLWIGETDKYRDHMLRLDAESRHSRFGGGVSDDFVRNYVDLSISLDAVVHGFFRRRRVARRRRTAAARRAASRTRRKPRSAWRSRGRVTASARRCCAAPCSPPATAAFGCCTWPASPKTGACSNWRANSTPNCRSISAASSAKSNPCANAAVADARNHGRQPRLRDGDARSAIADAASVTCRQRTALRATSAPTRRADRRPRPHRARRRPRSATRTARSARPRTPPSGNGRARDR